MSESWKINQSDVPEEHHQWSWNGADYERYRRHISVALGNRKESPHAFDVEMTRVPPGAAPCPVHSHENWWEFFMVVSGYGKIHRNGEEFDAVAGDCFLQPPGTRHRIRNASETADLVFYVIANEHPSPGGVKHAI